MENIIIIGKGQCQLVVLFTAYSQLYAQGAVLVGLRDHME